MSQKQWQQPEINEINIKNTESGSLQFVDEGTWVSEDGSQTVFTHS